MTSLTKLGLQGFAFGVALTSGGCMPQNQDQIDQLRAELTALKTEVATLKGNAPAAPASASAAAATPSEATPIAGAPGSAANPSGSATAPSGFDWESALEKHEKEERDPAWSRLREPDLFTAAKAHIKLYGASLNGVRCKTTSCLITVNVPKKPKAEYAVMANPWAGTEMFAHSKAIYSGRTLWSYLLTRHEKDTKEAAAERVDPVELAKKSPELVHATVLVSPNPTPEAKVDAKSVDSKPAPATPKAKAVEAAKPAAEPAKPEAEPVKPAVEGAKPEVAKAAKPAAAKPVAAAPAPAAAAPAANVSPTAPAAPASAAEAKTSDTKSVTQASKAPVAKPAAAEAKAPASKPVEAAKPTAVAADAKATSAKPAEAKPATVAPETKPAAAPAPTAK